MGWVWWIGCEDGFGGYAGFGTWAGGMGEASAGLVWWIGWFDGCMRGCMHAWQGHRSVTTQDDSDRMHAPLSHISSLHLPINPTPISIS